MSHAGATCRHGGMSGVSLRGRGSGGHHDFDVEEVYEEDEY